MRLFVALDLPWTLREQVSLLAGSGLPGARWVPPENYHMTLRFIGETPGHRAEDIDIALSSLRTRGFALTLSGVGTFTKGGRSTALWVGAERDGAATLRPGT
jgi:2'-5' RNA ligase